MIEDDVDVVRKCTQAWIQKGDSLKSLYEHFRSYSMHEYKEIKVMRNYICALLEFIPMLNEKGIQEIISKRYWIRTGVDIDDLQKQLISLFEYSISKGKSLNNINCLLSDLYNGYPEDYEPDEIALDLLEEVQLIELAGKSLAKYIEINGRPLPSQISKKDSSFNRFLKSGCYVQSYYMEGDEYVGSNSNLMCNELIKQYEDMKADYATFCDFIKPYLIKTNDPSEEEYEAQIIKADIYSIFDRYSLFEEFVHKTFSPNEEIEKKLEYIRNIMS